MAGTLERIWIKEDHGGAMRPEDAATLVTAKGVEGDACFGLKRQVTLVDAQQWERVEQKLEAKVDPGSRRANLLVSGVPLADTVGQRLRVGSTELLVRGETRPCGLMDEAHPGLQEALRPDWGGGVWADVVTGGKIRCGDAVVWLAAEDS